jgi:hypothetical protein
MPRQPKATPLLDKLLDAAVEIRQAPDAAELAYMARQLVQCTLPHSDPGNVPIWTRTNGALTLRVAPYFDTATSQHVYPYGSIPRLLLFWLVTEATRTKSRHIVLGRSLEGFMRAIGLNPMTGRGPRGDARRLVMQAKRLFRATISFEDSRNDVDTWLDMRIAPKGQTWWSPSKPAQDTLWDGWVELGEEFFDAITAAPVPVDYRHLKALKRSPLALDLYAWATYTAYSAARKRQARTVPWDALHGQIGGEYDRLRDFRAKATAALRKIQAVYPGLQIEWDTDALTVLSTSLPAISPK